MRVRVINKGIVTVDMGRRAIYFFKYKEKEQDGKPTINVKDAFLAFVKAHTLNEVGEKGAYEGFLINTATKAPLVKEYRGYLYLIT